jgi:AcrR family transcriptional regulator
MVQVIFKGQDNAKADNILEAARKRFGLFGFEKTTMKEIAADLSMSKGSLYYYFPDKEHLYKAIVYREHELFIQTIKSEIGQSVDPVIMLRKMALTRQGLFRTLINLGRSRSDLSDVIHTFMKDTIAALRLQEREIIRNILFSGVKREIFSVLNIDETADLLLDLLRGLRINILKEMSGFNMPSEEYEHLIKKTSLLVDIFVKGISVQPANS